MSDLPVISLIYDTHVEKSPSCDDIFIHRMWEVCEARSPFERLNRYLSSLWIRKWRNNKQTEMALEDEGWRMKLLWDRKKSRVRSYHGLLKAQGKAGWLSKREWLSFLAGEASRLSQSGLLCHLQPIGNCSYLTLYRIGNSRLGITVGLTRGLRI